MFCIVTTAAAMTRPPGETYGDTYVVLQTCKLKTASVNFASLQPHLLPEAAMREGNQNKNEKAACQRKADKDGFKIVRKYSSLSNPFPLHTTVTADSS
jgi:hypothetical protein